MPAPPPDLLQRLTVLSNAAAEAFATGDLELAAVYVALCRMLLVNERSKLDQAELRVRSQEVELVRLTKAAKADAAEAKSPK